MSIDLNKYRIYRTDSRNIAIQRKVGKRWETQSYHGNSLKSLVSGLFELIMSKHIPEAENIASALECLELELIRGIKEVKQMVEEYNGN